MRNFLAVGLSNGHKEPVLTSNVSKGNGSLLYDVKVRNNWSPHGARLTYGIITLDLSGTGPEPEQLGTIGISPCLC